MDFHSWEPYQNMRASSWPRASQATVSRQAPAIVHMILMKGMPRILLSTAHLVPSILDAVGLDHQVPRIIEGTPPLPAPYVLNPERLLAVKAESVGAYFQRNMEDAMRSAAKDFVSAPSKAIDLSKKSANVEARL